MMDLDACPDFILGIKRGLSGLLVMARYSGVHILNQELFDPD
jgi:hypothetical protein